MVVVPARDATMPRDSRRWSWIVLGLVGTGLLISGTLLARGWSLTANPASDAFNVCKILFRSSCDSTVLDATFSFAGVPMAGWGLVYYVSLACLLILASTLGKSFEPHATVTAVLLVEIAAGTSVLLAAVMISGRVPLCSLCLVVQGVNVALVPVIRRSQRYEKGKLLHATRRLFAYLSGSGDTPVETRWRFVGLVAIALTALVAYQWVLSRTQYVRFAAELNSSPDRIVAAFDSTPPQELTIDLDEPRLGADDAPNEIVVFSSFQCPGCQVFARDLRHIADKYADQVTVVFKHFPLGTDCNPHLGVDLQPRSCQAAWAAEAARRQGLFWPYHDALFETDLSADQETLRRLADEIGVDLVRFQDDFASAEAQAIVTSSVELGHSLGVDATPAVFLNGRSVQHVSRRTLEILLAR